MKQELSIETANRDRGVRDPDCMKVSSYYCVGEELLPGSAKTLPDESDKVFRPILAYVRTGKILP